jgi:hypothetical protein
LTIHITMDTIVSNATTPDRIHIAVIYFNDWTPSYT